MHKGKMEGMWKRLVSATVAIAFAASNLQIGIIFANETPDANNSSSESNSKFTVAPVSDEYISYMMGKGDKNTYSPSPIDTQDMSKVSLAKATYEYNLAAVSQLPSKFDLREKGLVSEVKDQGDYGTCWAQSTMGAIESSVMERNPRVNLSEWHLSNYAYSGDDALTPNGIFDVFDQGGFNFLANAVLSQWIGPVNESDAPYGHGGFFDN
jgi:C1A family cysteine protease